jgi:amidase/aspartyl-tRNA(Asn)/glutamyl-tRNA(Gln) amidotransferase subunit A
MVGHDAAVAGCVKRPVERVRPLLAQGRTGLRVGVLGGHFDRCATPAARAAVGKVAEALGARGMVELSLAEAGRAAAFLISNAEGGALHLPDLRVRAADFEPLSRDRFLAGALLPAAWVARAQRVRRAYALEAQRLFERFDLLLAPATPCAATPIGSEWLELNGERLPLRPSLGLLTQPISCIGLPVCAVPVWGAEARLPIGVQLIGAPWREDQVLRAAAALEAAGVVRAPVAALP